MIQWLKDLLHSPPQSLSPGWAQADGGGRADPIDTETPTLARQLALVIDLNVCVGCHACVTACKQWNTSGMAGPLSDVNPYAAEPTGTFFNRVQTLSLIHI